MSTKGITERERRFVEAYLGEAAGNGTKAAELAGYKGLPHTLSETARKVLARPRVEAYRLERLEACPLVARADECMAYLTDVLRGRATAQALSPTGKLVEVGPTLKERTTAAKVLLMAHGVFREAQQAPGNVTLVNVNIGGQQVLSVDLAALREEPKEGTVFVLPDNGRRSGG